MWLGINDDYECHVSGIVRNKKTKRELKTWMAGGAKRKYVYCRTGGANSKKTGLHRVVALTFLPQPTENNLEVDHIDRNPLNNHASNLRWVNKHVNALNKNLEVKARSNNKLGELYITKNECGYYDITINNTRLRHYSSHKTLDEAKKIRDALVDGLRGS